MKLIAIKKDTDITYVEKENNGAKILLDGKDYTDKIEFAQNPEITKKIVELFKKYKQGAINTGIPTYFDSFHSSLIIKECAELEEKAREITKESVIKRFSFLEKSRYFYKKFQKDDFFYYQFIANEKLGEVQYIYIKIPSDASKSLSSNFKVVKNGIGKRIALKERPIWFKNMYNKAREETREMHKLRRLLAVK